MLQEIVAQVSNKFCLNIIVRASQVFIWRFIPLVVQKEQVKLHSSDVVIIEHRLMVNQHRVDVGVDERGDLGTHPVLLC